MAGDPVSDDTGGGGVPGWVEEARRKYLENQQLDELELLERYEAAVRATGDQWQPHLMTDEQRAGYAARQLATIVRDEAVAGRRADVMARLAELEPTPGKRKPGRPPLDRPTTMRLYADARERLLTRGKRPNDELIGEELGRSERAIHTWRKKGLLPPE